MPPTVTSLNTSSGNTYSTLSGTSMATPHAAALAALVWSHFPNCSNNNIRNAINASAEDLGGDADLYIREGAAPTTGAYDCRPYTSGNNETCTISSPNTARYHIMLYGYSSFSAVNLTVSFEQAGSGNGGGGGGSGDADLYVRFGSNPTGSRYDCRPYLYGNAGTWYIRINAYLAFSGVTLSGSYE